MPDDIRPGALRPNAQLFRRGGTEGIPCAEQDLFPLAFKLVCKLADGSGLAYAVYAHHQDNGGLGLKLEAGVSHVQKLAHQLHQTRSGLVAVTEAALPGHFPQSLHHIFGGGGSHVGHYQQLFQLLVKILVVRGIVPKYLFKLLKVSSCLC